MLLSWTSFILFFLSPSLETSKHKHLHINVKVDGLRRRSWNIWIKGGIITVISFLSSVIDEPSPDWLSKIFKYSNIESILKYYFLLKILFEEQFFIIYAKNLGN